MNLGRHYLDDSTVYACTDGDRLTYCVVEPDRRGAFLPQKAIKLGVRDRRLFGKLSNGQDVVLEDGVTVVKSRDVLGPMRPGRGFIIDVHPHHYPHRPHADDADECPLCWRAVYEPLFEMEKHVLFLITNSQCLYGENSGIQRFLVSHVLKARFRYEDDDSHNCNNARNKRGVTDDDAHHHTRHYHQDRSPQDKFEILDASTIFSVSFSNKGIVLDRL